MRSKAKDVPDPSKKSMKNLTKMYLKAIEDQLPEATQTVPRFSMIGRNTNLSKSPIDTTKISHGESIFKKKQKKDPHQKPVTSIGNDTKPIEFGRSISPKHNHQAGPEVSDNYLPNDPFNQKPSSSLAVVDCDQKTKTEIDSKENFQNFMHEVSDHKVVSSRTLETASLYHFSFFGVNDQKTSNNVEAYPQTDQNKLEVCSEVIKDYHKKITELERANNELLLQLASYRTVLPESRNHDEKDSQKTIQSALDHLIDALNSFMENNEQDSFKFQRSQDPIEMIYEIAKEIMSKTYNKRPQINNPSNDNEEPCLKNKSQFISAEFQIPDFEFCQNEDDNKGLHDLKNRKLICRNHNSEEKLHFVEKLRLLLVSRIEDDSFEDIKPVIQTRKMHLNLSQNLKPSTLEYSSPIDCPKTSAKKITQSFSSNGQQIINVSDLLKEFMEVKRIMKNIESDIIHFGYFTEASSLTMKDADSLSLNISEDECIFQE